MFAAPSTTAPRRLGLTAAVAGAAALVLSACAAGDVASGSSSSASEGSSSGGGSTSVVIGGPDFTEAAIMENMYAEVLKDAGYETSIVTVANRELYYGQLSSGTIQVVPDYLGTLTEYMNTKANGQDAPPVASSDTAATLAEAKELARADGIDLLEPAKAQDQNAFAVTEEFAQQNNLKTLSDLGAMGQPVVLAGTEECPTRPFCVPGLESTYQIEVSSTTPTGFDTAATKNEVKSGKAQLGLVATTDATLGQFGLVELEDDKGLQQAENLVPAVNADVAQDQKLVDALNGLSETLTTQDLAQLNAQVDVERQLAGDVARKYLSDKELIGG